MILKDKNILFLCDDVVQHAFDTLHHGCLEIFGNSNVFEFPIVSKYHNTSKQFSDHPYKWWCYDSTSTEKNLNIDEWIAEIRLSNIDYIVFTNRGDAINNLSYILYSLDDNILNKLNIIFVEEEEDANFEFHRNYVEDLSKRGIYKYITIHYRADYIVKRVCNYDKIRPFYMSGPLSKFIDEIGIVKDFLKREIDICYMAGSSHPNRRKYFDILKNVAGNNVIEFGNYAGIHKRSLNEYFNVINNSKIFISVRGNGWGNTRNIEGPLCGAALFNDILDITVPYDYTDNVSAIFFDEKNLIDKLTCLLSDKSKLQNIAKNGSEHCLKYHTSAARARQMVEHVMAIK